MKFFFILIALIIYPIITLAYYQEKLIDASFQWNSDLPFIQIENTIKKSDKNLRVGIFINNAYADIGSIATMLKKIKSNQQFFWGTPKYFMEPDAFEKVSPGQLIKEIKEHHFKFVSEIMYRHADKINGTKHLTGERYFDPLNIKSIELIESITKLEAPIPIYIHWEFYRWKEDVLVFSKLFKKFPKQVFIINHLGFGTPSQVEFLIKNNRNVHFTISKRLKKFTLFNNPKIVQGPPILQKTKINPDWEKLFTNYPDRFLFAIDAHKPFMYDTYQHEIKNYRSFLGLLPIKTARKIAFQNATILFNLWDMK